MTSGEHPADDQNTPSPTNVTDGSPDHAQTESSSAPTESLQPPSVDAQPACSVDAQPAVDAQPVVDDKKLARAAGPLAARGLGVAKPASPTADAPSESADEQKSPPKKKKKHKVKPSGVTGQPKTPVKQKARVTVPNLRLGLPEDLQAELDAELAAADVDGLLGGTAGMADRNEPLAEGARVHGQVLKIHGDNVFISLGGPDEGIVPFIQFTGEEPVPGQPIEVMVRGVSKEDGLYILTLPGQAVEVVDWGDLDEGSVVEATVTGHNTGGLECKVGGVKGFIPISQVTEYRVEDLSEFVDQKFVCLVTEANVKRGNLVLSRRAILEREREEKRQKQLAQIEPGDVIDGTVRSIKDFGAFVDLGGCDGLIHISKLSWERIKHPSEVLEEGQKVSVRVDTIDKETGKIGLTFRDLQNNPWETAESDFAIGTTHKGTVSRIANFGCFVRLAAGVEGLVHISEIAHHRVTRVDTMVSEGQEVEVKVLSFDREAQKIGLSIKAAQQPPPDAKQPEEEETVEPAREPAVKPSHSGPLKGGNNRETGGERFGLRW